MLDIDVLATCGQGHITPSPSTPMSRRWTTKTKNLMMTDPGRPEEEEGDGYLLGGRKFSWWWSLTRSSKEA
jgi:hypothetical protein